MRIASKSIYDGISKSLSKTSSEMLRANEVVSSAKKIKRLSDDPVGLVTVLGLRSSLAGIEQLGRNITTGKSWLTMGESALTQVEELLSDAKTICVSLSSSTKGASERATASTTVEGLLEQALSLANTEVSGRHIFGGTKTDTIPFAFDNESDPHSVTYSGNDTAFSVKIGKDMEVAVGRDGEEVFGTSAGGIFKTLIDLKGYLRNNDVAGIQSSIDDLDEALQTVRTMISDTGAKTIRMEAKENIIADLELTYTDRKSQLEDADIAQAVIDLKAKELAYQAALASSAKVMALSLVDYV